MALVPILICEAHEPKRKHATGQERLFEKFTDPKYIK